GASAAVAFGWSLRPFLSDGLAGLYLGIIGRHAPGTPVQLPDSRGTIHLPGPFRTVVRTESGALHTVPNRQLVTESSEASLGGRTAITVKLSLPLDRPPRSGLAAIQWACTLLPWTGEEPAKVRPPGGHSDALWIVEMVILGNAPPVDKVRAVFFDLVLAVLQSEPTDAAASVDAPPPESLD
ncbi:MAG TPA: hypothetical protein DFR83_08340, partial [Deltaproteobacteria bacterium]|nr:hypothetical protein [Deltaproteobacteria bacterium]